jgi:hypothetical protein
MTNAEFHLTTETHIGEFANILPINKNVRVPLSIGYDLENNKIKKLVHTLNCLHYYLSSMGDITLRRLRRWLLMK